MKTICVLVFLFGSLSLSMAGESRTWTSTSGTTLEASFERLFKSTVILKTDEGKELRVPLAKLSQADQDYVAAQTPDSPSSLVRAPTSSRSTTRQKDEIQADYLTEAEREVIQEMNLARTDPKAYAEFIKAYRATHIEGNIFARNGMRMMTQEGLPAVDEAIAFLEEVKPVGPLKPSKGLSLASKSHADDIGPKGIVGHVGSNGSTFKQRIEAQGRWDGEIGENISFGPTKAREIVMLLIIDDGVPNRGHRVNIFNKKYGRSGVNIGIHSKYGHCCVITYSGGFKD
jgi:uncharacterized protein YkwD